MLATALLIAVYGGIAVFHTPTGAIRSRGDVDFIDAISFTALGFLLVVPSLLAFRAGLASRSRVVAWLRAMWLASVFGLLVAYAEIRHEGYADLDRDLPACLSWLVVLAGAELPLAVLRRCGWRLELIAAPDASPGDRACRPLPQAGQMTVRQMMAGTTAIGLIFAGMRWLFPISSFDDTSALWASVVTSAAIGGVVALVTLPVYTAAWCLLAAGRIRLRVALATTTAAILGALALWLWNKADQKTAVDLSCLVAGMILSAAMTFSLWRACGYRLIRLSGDTPLPAAEPLPSVGNSSFVLALAPPVVVAILICGIAPHRFQLWREADEVQRWAEENIGVAFQDGTGKITELWCPDEMQLSDALLKRIGGLSDLTLLDLSGTDLDDRQLALLPPLESLRTLCLGRTKITDDGIASLPRFPNLEYVSLEMNGVTDEAIDALSNIEHLDYVDLSWTNVTEQGQNRLRDLRWRRNRQSLPICWMTGDEGLSDLAGGRWRRKRPVLTPHRKTRKSSAFGTLAPLTRLCARGRYVTDAGLKSLAALTDLEDLDLRDARVTDAGLKALAVLTKLRKLDLRGTQVTETGVRRLSRTLPDCHIVSVFE
jgi:hypothetical protein